MRRDTASILVLALVPAIGLGIARFAYALVLPAMRDDLGWTFSEAGWLNASNAAGYLLGALLCARTLAITGTFRVMVAGIFACVLSLVLCAVTENAILLNLARGLAGLGGGFAFVAGGVLAAGLAQKNPSLSALFLGIFYAGPGLGIFLSGISIPFVLQFTGSAGWMVAWAILAAQALVLAVVVCLRADLRISQHASASAGGVHSLSGVNMPFMLGGYCLFGAGYIAYMTFMIAWVQNDGGPAVLQATFWALIGAAAMISPWVWAALLRRLRNGLAFATLAGVTATGALLPLLSGSFAVLLASAALFGLAFFAVVASTTAFVRRNLPPSLWATAIGRLTVAFSLGQVLGPVIVGAVNDRTQGLSGGLWVSVLLLAVAALTGALQRDLKLSDG